MGALSAHGFETFIDGFAERAEFWVAGIAESEDGILEIGDGRRSAIPDPFPKRFGVVGRIAVAVGAGDDEDTPFGGQLVRRVIGEIVDSGSEAKLARFVGGALRERFGVTSL